MKKKFIILLIAVAILVSISSISLVLAAGNAYVTFSGPSLIRPGKTYTYNYTLHVNNACAANANISVGGAFEKVSGGENLFYDTIPKNTTGTVSGSVTVRVKSNANPGDAGIISVIEDESKCSELQFDSSGKVKGDPIITTVTGSISVPVTFSPTVTATPGDGCVTLSWKPVPGATKYAIAYWKNNGWVTLTYNCTDTSYTVTDLVSGRSYTFLVQAYVDGKWSKFDSTDYVSATPTGPTKPAPKVTTVGDGSVTLSWNKISGATKYAIAYLNNSGAWTTLTYNCTDTSYTATGLINRKEYTFLVQAYLEDRWSSYTSADFVKATPQDPNRPVVKATPGKGSVTLSWNPVSGATAYAVAYYKNGWVTLTYDCTDTSYTVTDLVSGRSYTFLVQAKVDGKWSKYDSTDYVSATPTGPTKPAPKVTAVGDGSVTLSWERVSAATAYAIAYLNNSGKWTTLTYDCTDTTYTITDLVSGKTYTFLVQAKVDGKWSKFDSTDYVYATPTGPTKPAPKVTAVGDGSVTLSWNKISGATKYAIAYLNSSGGWTTLTYNCAGTTYTATGLTNRKLYIFLVQSYADGKWSSFSSADYVKGTPQDPNRPVVKATPGHGSVTLSWNPVSGATAYAVAYYKNGWDTLTYDCTDTTYTITDLVSGKTYTFLVQAKVDGKWSKYDGSDYAYATPTGPTKPAPKVTAVGDGSVTLSWDKISGATKYAIAYWKTNGWFTLTYNCTDTTYTATGLTNRKEYTFLVQSYADGKWSSYTSADYVKGTPQDPRPFVKATPGNGSVTLSWDPVPGATAYAIAYYKNGWVTLTYDCTDTTYTITDLVSGKTYTFLVQSYRDGKWSKYDSTDYVSATPTGPTKPAPKVTAVGDGSVTLSWDKISGATKYAIAYLNSSGGWTTLTYDCTDTTYTITDLVSGKKYTFLVQSYRDGKWSKYDGSDYVYATPTGPTKPAPKVTAVGEDSITLSWDPVPGATAYAIAYLNSSGGWTTLTYDCTDTTYTATGLESGKKYTFLVQSKVEGKWSSYNSSDYVTATPGSG